MAKRVSEQFFSIDLEKLVEGKGLPFDLHLHLPLNNRVILILRKGEDLESGIVTRLKRFGLKYLHLRNEDTAAYKEYMEGRSKPAALDVDALQADAPEKSPTAVAEPQAKPAAVPQSEPDESPKPKTELETKTETETETETVSEPVTKTAAEPAEDTAPAPDTKKESPPPLPEPEAVMAKLMGPEEKKKEAIAEGKKMVKELLKAAKGSAPQLTALVDNLAAEHGTNVAIYASLIAMGLGKREPRLLQDLILACLFHDVGLTQVPSELLAIPETKRNAGQTAQFAKHVLGGLELLSEVGYTPNERVTALIRGHHEKFNGTGYPDGLESFQLDDLGQIVSFAVRIDEICRGYYDGEPRQLGEALKLIMANERQSSFPMCFNPDIFRQIMNWLKSGTGEALVETATESVKTAKQNLAKAS